MKNLRPYLLVLCLVVLPLLLAEFYGCSVSGKEFSPDDFSARSFYYRRSPLTGFLRSKRKNEDQDLYCDSIVGNGHVTVVNSTPKQWDLYSENMQYGNKLSHEFDARFLTHFLNHNTGDWTTSYPEEASMLWPEVATMAREGLYLYLPDILQVAIPDEYTDSVDRTLKEFKSDIQAEFVEAYQMAAKVAKANDDPKESQWLKAAEKYKSGDFGNDPTGDTTVTAEAVSDGDLEKIAN